MKEERKSLKIQVEDGKMDGGSCSWDVREDIPREKMAELLLNGGGRPLPLLPGEEAVMVWMQILRLKVRKKRKPGGSSSSYFCFLCEV